VDPREVPLLPGVAPAPARTAPADPKADFSPLEVRNASHFDADKSEVVARSTFATEFENPDGGSTGAVFRWTGLWGGFVSTRVVVVHGVGQEFRGPELMSQSVGPALRDGVWLPRGSALAPAVACAFWMMPFRANSRSAVTSRVNGDHG
jgi:hypothetical protein